MQSVLHGVIELDPNDRGAYLDRRCGDTAVREQVESFLGSYERIGNFLEPPTVENGDRAPFSWTGQMAGSYRVLEELGRGGMGVVYKAEHTSLLRTVALKFLPAETARRPAATARFVREARAASALNHPNICTVYEVGDASGHPFIAMEFVEGRPLDQLIPLNGLPFGAAVDYGLQISDALAHAHQRGVVHRDLKPSNVMITPEGRVKVLDFGLAKRSGLEPALDDLLTQQGTLIGTPAYMAPEALRCEATDARADLWALGLLLYQITSGRLPFEGKSGHALKSAILSDPIASLPSRVPADFRRVVARCLEKQPDDRYQTAAHVTLDLQRCASSTKRRLARRSRIDLALASASLIAVLAMSRSGPLTYRPPSTQLPDQRIVAVLPYTDANGSREGQAYSDGLRETVATLLGDLEPSQKLLRVIPIDEIRARRADSERAAGRVLGVNLILTGRVERGAGRIRITTELKDAKTLRMLGWRTQVIGAGDTVSFQKYAAQTAADLLQLNLPSADQPAFSTAANSPKGPPMGAYESYLEGRGYLDRYDLPGNVDLSVQRFRSAIADQPGYALAYAGLSEAYWRKYALTKDTQWLEHAQELGRRAVEIDPKTALAHVTLGNVYAETGKTEAAIGEFRTALSANPVSVAGYRGLATIYEKSGQLKSAEETYLKATRMRPNDWVTLTMLGTFYYDQGRMREAEPIFIQITRLLPDSQLCFANLGALHAAMSQYGDAFRDYEKSIAIAPTALGYLGMAALYFDQRKFADSAVWNEKAVALTGDASYTALGNLAQSYQWTPALAARAPAVYQRAIAVTGGVLATNGKDSFALACRAVYESQLGMRSESLKDARKALALAPDDVRVALHAAIVYERSGDRLHALAAVKRALADKASGEAIAHEPDLDGLQRDHRFKELITAQVAKGSDKEEEQ